MAKKLNVIGIVFMALAAVGLILAIVGMCTGVVSAMDEGVTLFDKQWETLESMAPAAEALGITMPSRVFPIIAFIVAILGALVVLVHGILGMLGKDIKILGLTGGAVAILGGILVIVASFVLAGQFNNVMEKVAGMKDFGATAGIGAWIGAIGGILAGVAGILGALKVGQKD